MGQIRRSIRRVLFLRQADVHELLPQCEPIRSQKHLGLLPAAKHSTDAGTPLVRLISQCQHAGIIRHSLHHPLQNARGSYDVRAQQCHSDTRPWS